MNNNDNYASELTSFLSQLKDEDKSMLIELMEQILATRK